MKHIQKALALLCTLVLCLTCCLPVYAHTEDCPYDNVAVPANGVIPANEWMKYVDCNALITGLNIPGSHDAGMYCNSSLTADYALTQKTDIAGQLEAGARIFDIRLRYGGDNKAVICHGQGQVLRYDAEVASWSNWALAWSAPFTIQLYSYDMVISEICDFLDAHPSETVILTVRHEYKATDHDPDYDEDGNKQNIDTAIAEAESIIEERGKELVEIKKVDRFSIPYTMGDLRNKIVRFEYGCEFGSLMDDVYNGYEYTFADKWNVLLPYFDAAPDQDTTVMKSKKSFRAAYTSCTGMKTFDKDGKVIQNNVGLFHVFDDEEAIIPTPSKEAKSMRKLLLNYPFEKGGYYGWLAMDFVDEDLARVIFESNNFRFESGRKKAPTTYISDIRGFCDDDFDDAVEECLSQGYQILVGQKKDGSSFRDVNPDGDPIVIGYKTTVNPNDAIRDIVGTFDDDDGPDGWTKVKVDGSLFNYFTRWSGSKSEDTYLFYTKKASAGAPIMRLTLSEDKDGKNTVKKVDTDETFNLQAGLDRFYSLSVTRDKNVSKIGTLISEGNAVILIGCGMLLAAAVIFLIAVKSKKKQNN